MKKVILLVAFITAYVVSSQAQFVIENFDNTHLGSWVYKGDNASAFNAQATLTGLVGSTYSGYVFRNGGDQYDNIVYTLTATSLFTSTTVSALKNGTLKFQLSIATQAAIGIDVKIKLQSSLYTNSTNGFSGNSEYDAITTVGGNSNPYNWETLKFGSVTGLGSITDAQVDQIVIFFVPNSNSSDKFFFDNLQIIDPTATTSGTGTTTGIVDNSIATQNTSIFPNPTNGIANINYVSSSIGDVKVTLNDMVGKEISAIQDNGGGDTFNGQVDVSALEAGIYYVKFQQDGGTSWLKKLVVSK